MSTTRIVTLFGEEITPDPPQQPGRKARGKKKDEEAQEESNTEENAADAPVAVAAENVATDAVETIIAETPAAIEETEALVNEEIEIQEAPAQPEIHETPLPGTPAAIASPQAPVSTPESVADNTQKPTVADRRKLLAAIRKTEPKVEEPAATAPPAKAARKAKPVEEEPGKEEGIGKEEAPAIIPEDWTGDKKYYTIGEVAGLFSVKTSHIRFWTNEFKLKVRTTRKGDRLYTPEQVKELRTIYHLVKERGFTLTGAKSKLKTQNKRDVTTIDLKDSLLALRDKLQILRDQL